MKFHVIYITIFLLSGCTQSNTKHPDQTFIAPDSFIEIDIDESNIKVSDDRLLWSVRGIEGEVLSEGSYQSRFTGDTGEKMQIFFRIDENGLLTDTFRSYLDDKLYMEVVLNNDSMRSFKQYYPNNILCENIIQHLSPDTLSYTVLYDITGTISEEIIKLINGHTIIITRYNNGDYDIDEYDKTNTHISGKALNSKNEIRMDYNPPRIESDSVETLEKTDESKEIYVSAGDAVDE